MIWTTWWLITGYALAYLAVGVAVGRREYAATRLEYEEIHADRVDPCCSHRYLGCRSCCDHWPSGPALSAVAVTLFWLPCVVVVGACRSVGWLYAGRYRTEVKKIDQQVEDVKFWRKQALDRSLPDDIRAAATDRFTELKSQLPKSRRKEM